ncbi:MAG: response regulator [Nitrospirota bacterium]
MPKKQILIVEDEPVIALDIQYSLTKAGYSVTGIAVSVDGALSKITDDAPDLVLMDIVIKGDTDGIEAARLIREQHDIPVVFLTAYGDDETLQRAKQACPFGFVLKPFEDRDLRAAVEVALSKHEADQRVKERVRWLDATIRGLGDGVIATDRQGRVSFMNSVAEAITGWSQAEAVGRAIASAFDVRRAGSRIVVEAFVAEAVEERRPVGLPGRTSLIARDGVEHPISGSVTPVWDARGNVVGAVVAFYDVLLRSQGEGNVEGQTRELQDAMRVLRILKGLLPICASCKRIRDQHGDWKTIETYFGERSEIQFSHGICPMCLDRLYPGIGREP